MTRKTDSTYLFNIYFYLWTKKRKKTFTGIGFSDEDHQQFTDDYVPQFWRIKLDASRNLFWW